MYMYIQQYCMPWYLGVVMSLYSSFSSLVEAAIDIGMTMLFMLKALSPFLLRTGIWEEQTTHNIRLLLFIWTTSH